MPAARIDEAAEVALALHVQGELAALEKPHRAVVVLLVQLALPVAKLLEVSRLGRNVHMVRPVVALDAVIADQRLREIERFHGHVEQAPRVLAPDLGDQGLLTDGEAEDELPAAATRSPEADAVRLEQRDAVAAFGEMQGGGAARDACAHDRDVDAVLAGERRAGRARSLRSRGGVIGAGGR